jgi:Sensors of blue-light using FAD
MALVRLIYRSENALSVSGSRVFVHYHDIVSTARRRNSEHNITGFLMFDRDRYHQILEGDAEVVDRLYGLIRRDTRHTNVETMAKTEISTRGFPEWSMGSFLVDGRQHPIQLRHGITNGEAVAAETFLKFALDFVAKESEIA